jgi:hypothetical protein
MKPGTIVRKPGLSFTGEQYSLAIPAELRDAVNNAGDLQIFLHIPKCAGTSLDFVMASCAHFRGATYCRFVVRDADPPVWMTAGWTGAWTDVRDVGGADRENADYISGHFPFGAHVFFGRAAHYVSMVREPVSRELSNYNFHYQRAFHDGSRSLLDLIDDRAVLDNPQVRMLAGVDAMTGDCTEATHESALNNIAAKFALIAPVESSGEFMSALLALNGWPPVAYPRAQITGVKLIEEADAALSNRIREYHRFDVRLHQQVADRWQAWKAENVMGIRSLEPDERVVFIPPDYQKNRNYGLVSKEELEANL